MTSTFVLGVGMTKFEKPGVRPGDYPDMAVEAAVKALIDAGIQYDQVQFAAVGYCYGDSTCGQRSLYPLGMTSIPIINVNNNCSTGSTALYMARNMLSHYDVVMALGFEKMAAGSLGSMFSDRSNPLEPHIEAMNEKFGIAGAPIAPQIFGNAGVEYLRKYADRGVTAEHFAKVAHKNHTHSTLNPYSQFRKEYTLEQIKNSRPVFGPLTMLQCCPTSDGAACAILVNERFLNKHPELKSRAIQIVAQSMATDSPQALGGDGMELAGFGMSQRAARDVFEQAGISPNDVQVVELHDCFSTNEVITYEALGLCKPGEASSFIDNGNVTYGGKFVVNPSGGLISKGHPLGATGLAQCCELSWQLRGWCGDRQVQNVQYALQHNIGLGGAAVVTLYKKAYLDQDSWQRHGYNPAIECRGISAAELENVQAKAVNSRLKAKL